MGGRGASSVNKFDPLKVPSKLKEHYDKIKDKTLDDLRPGVYKANNNYNKISNADKIYSRLVEYVKSKGYKFREEAELPGNGRTRFSQNNPPEILIKPTISTEGKIKTLAHEIGHAVLHNPKNNYTNNRGVKELEAETIGHMVAGKYGIDTKNYSYTYIAGWMRKNNVPKSQIDASFPKSFSVYNDIINGVGEP